MGVELRTVELAPTAHNDSRDLSRFWQDLLILTIILGRLLGCVISHWNRVGGTHAVVDLFFASVSRWSFEPIFRLLRGADGAQ